MSQLKSTLFSQRSPEDISTVVPVNEASVWAIQSQAVSRCYSLKYVLDELETSEINQRPYRMEAGSFLIVAQGSDICVNIDSKQLVEGLRGFLKEETVKVVWTTLHKTQAQLLENRNWKIMLPSFFENNYRSTNNELASLISTYGQNLKNKILSYEQITDEFFYSLALALSQHQEKHLAHIAALPAQKKTTREELYRRILVTRDYMHENFTRHLSLSDLADIANISEFHYLRTFKITFGESPYQYLLRLRLNLAKELLLQKEQNINELALECGFNEVQAFLKLFRKEFGVGPTLFRKLNQE